MHAPLVVLDSYSNSMQAEIVKGRLEEAGITVFLADNTESAQQPGVPMPSWTSIRLLVSEKDVERARRILAPPAFGPAPER